MAGPDYDKLAKKAEKLVTNAGRTVTLVKPVKTLTNPSQPWNGPAAPNPGSGNPDDDEIKLPVPGVQLLPNSVRIFGLLALGDANKFEGLVTYSELVYIIFAGEENLESYTFVRDDGIDYAINATQQLKPANTTLLGFVGVRR